jgi:serine/arginine repetitive matrix protein 2
MYANIDKIKNHYQKFVNDGKHMDMIQDANDATRRRNLGEDMGPPPAPTQAAKRRYDTSQPPVPRTLAPNTDVIDLDQSPTLQPAMPVHASPPQFAAPNRFPPLSQPSRQTSSSGVPGSVHDIHGSTPAMLPRTSHSSGPRMGFFTDEPRTTALAHNSSHHQPAQQQKSVQPAVLQDDSRIAKPIERIKTEYEPSPSRTIFAQLPSQLAAEREREHRDRDREHERERERERERVEREREREMILQQQRERNDHFARIQAKEDARAQLQLEQQEHLYSRQSHQNPFQSTGSHQPAALHRLNGPDPMRLEQRPPSGAQYGVPQGHVANALRGVVEGSSSQLQPRYDQSHRSIRPPSPPTGTRPAQPAAPSRQANQPPNPGPPPATRPEPSKRVNIMSMLNPEPEEERPKKRDVEQSVPASSGTPVQQYRMPHSEATTTPREAFGDIARPYSRPSFGGQQTTPTSTLSTPITESGSRDSLPSVGHRDNRPGRQAQYPQTHAQQSHSGHQHQIRSPHAQQQQQHQAPPETRQGMFNRDYRAPAFSSLNQQSRHNPSPPPMSAYPHSRTPSFSHQSQQQQNQHPTPPASGAPAQPGPASNLRANPYAHKEPSSGPPSHSANAQMPQARSEVSQGPNQYLAHLQNQHEARFDRFRERESDLSMRDNIRERSDLSALAQIQRYNQHTPPANQPRYPPPERTGHTPLNHLGYAPPAGQAPQPADQRTLEYQQEIARREQERTRQREERMVEEARRIHQLQADRAAQEEDILRRQQHEQQQQQQQPPHSHPQWRSAAERYMRR